MTKNIYLYCDDGADDFCIDSAERYFNDDVVMRVTAHHLIEHGISDNIDMLIMPGGADKPYAHQLNGRGNYNIQQYVRQGGTYLGLCAGAYYGCSSIEFQKSSPHAICENRELAFFKGTGIGCLTDIAPLYDKSLHCATIARLTTAEGKTAQAVYWGGCAFPQATEEDYTIIARYDDIADNPPAVISCPYGEGRAILSGVHLEMTLSSFEDLYVLNNPKEAKALKSLKDRLQPTDIVMMSSIMREYLCE